MISILSRAANHSNSSVKLSKYAAIPLVLSLHRHIHLCVLNSIQLNDWKDSLAPEVDLTAASRPTALPHRLMLHASYWWLFILLHRPFYRRAKSASSGGPEIDHVKVSNNS